MEKKINYKAENIVWILLLVFVVVLLSGCTQNLPPCAAKTNEQALMENAMTVYYVSQGYGAMPACY